MIGTDYKEAHAGDFRHVWCVDKTASIVEKIDRYFGGWPVAFNQLGFEHSDSRIMTFAKNKANNGWWTCILNDMEYYRHKCGAPDPSDLEILRMNLGQLNSSAAKILARKP
jgi:hypothetical protein